MNPSALARRTFRRVLLIKPSAVGDVIHTVPVLAKLRRRYPDARIDWLLAPHVAELIRHHPALSNVLLFTRHGFGREWGATRAFFELLLTIGRNRYDLVIDLHGQFRSALFTLASGAPVRIGFDRPRRPASQQRLVKEAYRHAWTGTREGAWVAYTHRIPIPTLDVHAVDRYLWLGRLLGLDDEPADFHIPLPAAAVERVDRLLGEQGLLGRPLAVVVPGTLWETKHWTVEGFAGVGRHLLQQGYAVALSGSAKERDRCQAVAQLCPGAVELAGKTTLTELAALLRRAALCVTNDSGSMHLAVAVGSRVVSVFGPTDPLWVGPYQRPDAVVQASAPCGPCYLRKVTACPHGHACMQRVTPQMVIDRIQRLAA